MPDLLRDHRVVLGQFRVGALGNAELEALACGVPVAAAFRYPDAYASPPPLVAGGVDDPEAVAHALAALLDDVPARAALAAASVAWIGATYAAPTIARRLIEVYREVLDATS
jgi:glycosyltransferase involved in cell wall biosynthesis